MIRVLAAALCVFAVTFFVACGGGGQGTPAEKIFGGLSDRDVSLLQDWSLDLRDVPETQVKLVAALDRGDFNASRSAVDLINEALTKADRRVIEFDSSEVRTILGDYMGPLRNFGLYLDRLVSAAEEEVTSGIPMDAVVANALLAEGQGLATAVKDNEARMVNRVLDVLSPEQRENFRARYRQLSDRLEAAGAP